MNFFALLFYFLAAFSILILASIINSLARGRVHSALKTLRVYLVPVAIYATALVATTLATPVQVLPGTETQYSGDWSITVASIRRVPHGLDEDYELDFRLGNRSKKPASGVKNLTVHLVGEDGTRYNPEPDPSTPPFDVSVKPGKSVITTRRFVLPTNLNRVELVTARQCFRLSWFIIGRSPFDGHTALLLQ